MAAASRKPIVPSVYLETTIPSYLVARLSPDGELAAKQAITRSWWENHRHRYKLVTAEIVLSEAAKGDANAAGRRLEVLKDVVVLDSSERVDLIAEWLTGRGLVPVEAAADAFHIGNAIVHEIDYLLTWNCTHIANPTTRPKIEECLRREGMHVPTICTPEELVRWNHD